MTSIDVLKIHIKFSEKDHLTGFSFLCYLQNLVSFALTWVFSYLIIVRQDCCHLPDSTTITNTHNDDENMPEVTKL